MSTTAEKHPSAIRAVLKRARMSEGSELNPEQLERAGEAVKKPTLKDDRLYNYILHGTTEGSRSASSSTRRSGGAKARGRQVTIKYPPAIKAAAKRVRELSGGKGSPGAKQVDLVNKVLHGRDPVEATGMSERALRSWAKGTKSPKTVGGGFLELAGECNDSFCRGRRLAMIVVALAEQAKSGAKG